MTLRPGVHTVPTADRDGLTALMRGIADALEGLGPVLPLGPDRKHPAALANWSPFGPRGWLAALPPSAGALLATSGSQGEPKVVTLSAGALEASAHATHEFLAGPGRWLLALPTHHIAGFQVVARSVLAGTTPVQIAPGPFTADAFTAAAEKLATESGPTYVSLVPTQLARIIADDAARQTLARFTAVLVGGAALNPTLAAAANEAEIRLVRTYGMSETAGGCVYDGQPLPGVEWLLSDDGQISLTGPMLAEGYLGRPDLTAAAFSTEADRRWFHTSDLGQVTEGSLEVLGRRDDVIISGGINLAPGPIEAALTSVPGVAEAVVVGVPDPQWGQAVIALITGSGDPGELREVVRERLGSSAVPKQIIAVPDLPQLDSGKIDRAAALQLAENHRSF